MTSISPTSTSPSARSTTCSSWGTIWSGITRFRLGFSRRQGQSPRPRRSSRAHARPHSHRGRPLQGKNSELGRRQRSAQRRRHDAPVALVQDHRPDYIEKAFQYAHEADPQAQLFYNDYNLENEPKRNGAIALVKKLQADGIPITGVGIAGPRPPGLADRGAGRRHHLGIRGAGRQGRDLGARHRCAAPAPASAATADVSLKHRAECGAESLRQRAARFRAAATWPRATPISFASS
jgi:hypothetical protein